MFQSLIDARLDIDGHKASANRRHKAYRVLAEHAYWLFWPEDDLCLTSATFQWAYYLKR